MNDTAYVVDCGDGVARQLVLAGIRLPQLRHIFLTHQHSDHNADYGNLMSILSHHTSAEDAGLVAKQAGVETLVLSHFVPPEDPQITDRMWIEAASMHFDGKIVVGRDLLEL